MSAENGRPVPPQGELHIPTVVSFFGTLFKDLPMPTRNETGRLKYGLGSSMPLGETRIFFLDFSWKVRYFRNDYYYTKKDFPTVLVERKGKRFHRKTKAVVEKVRNMTKIFDSLIVEGVTDDKPVALTIREDGTYDYETIAPVTNAEESS